MACCNFPGMPSAGLPPGRLPVRWILIQLRPSGCRNRIHIQLPGCLPERSPADHPDEVVVDIVPLYTRPATGRETLSEAGFGFTAHLTVWPNSTLALALPIWPVPRFGTRKSPPPVLGARNSPLPPPQYLVPETLLPQYLVPETPLPVVGTGKSPLPWYQKLPPVSAWYQKLTGLGTQAYRQDSPYDAG